MTDDLGKQVDAFARLTHAQAIRLASLAVDHPGGTWHWNDCGCCFCFHPPGDQRGGYVVGKDGEGDYLAARKDAPVSWQPLGTRVRFKYDWLVWPHAMVAAWSTGTLVEPYGETLVAVKLDSPSMALDQEGRPGLTDWDDEVHFHQEMRDSADDVLEVIA